MAFTLCSICAVRDDSWMAIPRLHTRWQIRRSDYRVGARTCGGLGLALTLATVLVCCWLQRWRSGLGSESTENIAKKPKRLKGFATLPLQDPDAAAQELTRCVRDLGFCGALVNGFSEVGEAGSAVYYDLPQFRPFWATVHELGVPFYLHPRDPSSTKQQCYEGYRWLAGSPWGFGVETSIHALRLMASGLFDEYPKLKVILGHLGKGLPFGIWRVDHRISRGSGTPKARLPMSHYLRENFYITTSGNFRTQALTNVILEVGADRVLYSVDYPYEDVVEAKVWFEHAAISESDRIKIACTNAQKLFRL